MSWSGSRNPLQECHQKFRIRSQVFGYFADRRRHSERRGNTDCCQRDCINSSADWQVHHQRYIQKSAFNCMALQDVCLSGVRKLCSTAVAASAAGGDNNENCVDDGQSGWSGWTRDMSSSVQTAGRRAWWPVVRTDNTTCVDCPCTESFTRSRAPPSHGGVVLN